MDEQNTDEEITVPDPEFRPPGPQYSGCASTGYVKVENTPLEEKISEFLYYSGTHPSQLWVLVDTNETRGPKETDIPRTTIVNKKRCLIGGVQGVPGATRPPSGPASTGEKEDQERLLYKGYLYY